MDGNVVTNKSVYIKLPASWAQPREGRSAIAKRLCYFAVLLLRDSGDA